MNSEKLVVCDQCALVMQMPSLEPGCIASCTRCGFNLYRYQPHGLEHSLVFALTAAVLFLIANAFPIVNINSQGLTSSTTLIGAVELLMHDEMHVVAALVFATTFLMPALEISAMIYLLLPLQVGCVPPGVSAVFRMMKAVKPWAMIEVFMIGLLITISKLNGLASVVPEIALGAFVLLMFSVTAAGTNFNVRLYWRQVEKLGSRISKNKALVSKGCF